MLYTTEHKWIDLSLDQRPDRPDEKKRIEWWGGFVSFKRVLGRLWVSRWFGDFEYKKGLELDEEVDNSNWAWWWST